MLKAYIEQAMAGAVAEKMENGRYFLKIPGFRGVWADGDDVESAREELAEVLEEWILLALKRGVPLPVIGGYDLNKIGVLV